MTTQLSPFEFKSQQLRVVADENGEPWFVASDVCAVLTINTEQTRRLDEDEKGLRTVQTPGGPQEMAVINESGLYSLILTSRKPEAKPFKKWVTSEVLPTIRKTGAYSTVSLPEPPTKKAFPGGLTLEQQDAIKAMVKGRVEVLPKDKQAKAAITCWSSIKSKYGCSYKAIAPEHFTSVCSLVARLVLEGEVLPAEEHPKPTEFPSLINRRFLTSFSPDGKEHVQCLPIGVAVIDPNNDDNLQMLVGEYIPLGRLHFVALSCLNRLDAMARRK
jgi:prophage antirepressor-like protein